MTIRTDAVVTTLSGRRLAIVFSKIDDGDVRCYKRTPDGHVVNWETTVGRKMASTEEWTKFLEDKGYSVDVSQ